jgi:large conductance mechanosensitive channel
VRGRNVARASSIFRANVFDLAVAVVMGVALGAVVAALVKDSVTPLIAAIVGKPDFSAIEFTVNGTDSGSGTSSIRWSRSS